MQRKLRGSDEFLRVSRERRVTCGCTSKTYRINDLTSASRRISATQWIQNWHWRVPYIFQKLYNFGGGARGIICMRYICDPPNQRVPLVWTCAFPLREGCMYVHVFIHIVCSSLHVRFTRSSYFQLVFVYKEWNYINL